MADIVNAVGNSPCTDLVNGQNVPYWKDTAIFIVWDWGGFWDHVQPYEVLINTGNNCSGFGCGYVSGFRVPFLVASAFTGTLNNGVIDDD